MKQKIAVAIANMIQPANGAKISLSEMAHQRLFQVWFHHENNLLHTLGELGSAPSRPLNRPTQPTPPHIVFRLPT